MIARIFSDLGLDMGHHVTANTSEDKRIRTFAKDADLGGFESYCRDRDALADTWAFKVPAFRTRINEFSSVMRNPRFVITFRDILAVTVRNQIAIGVEFMDALRQAAKGYSTLVEQVSKVNCPILLISYEKSLQYPRETVSAIAEFCGVKLTTEEVIRLAERNIINGDPRYHGGQQ
ncbi:sulfotransferase [Aquibium sp. LZ166]|uniref:Sulfotransferase n=1 Tax=Aquibium pacificus TaxID=3153579 RepID=A0ABV3SSG3_9HYPH